MSHNFVIQFDETQLRVMSEANRTLVAGLFAEVAGAPDVAESIRSKWRANGTSPAGTFRPTPSFVNFIEAGKLRSGDILVCPKKGVEAEVIPTGVMFEGHTYNHPTSLLYAMIRRGPRRGPKLNPMPRLRRLNPDGSATTLKSMLAAVEADMRARESVNQLMKLLALVDKPLHVCPTCQSEQREVTRTDLSSVARIVLIKLLCNHTLSLEVGATPPAAASGDAPAILTYTTADATANGLSSAVGP